MIGGARVHSITSAYLRARL